MGNIEWLPIGEAPEEMKDGRRVLGYAETEGGPCTMAWSSGEYGGTPGWRLAPHYYEEASLEPSLWAEINPPSDNPGIPVYASRDATDDVLGQRGVDPR